mmetsp:Transcript_44048/g.132052  ORF Transcript_44048/g.132052 Transcript_44048/m.132052 type:complete len:211 (-) Transcript_44048:959-1591(-)
MTSLERSRNRCTSRSSPNRLLLAYSSMRPDSGSMPARLDSSLSSTDNWVRLVRHVMRPSAPMRLRPSSSLRSRPSGCSPSTATRRLSSSDSSSSAVQSSSPSMWLIWLSWKLAQRRLHRPSRFCMRRMCWRSSDSSTTLRRSSIALAAAPAPEPPPASDEAHRPLVMAPAATIPGVMPPAVSEKRSRSASETNRPSSVVRLRSFRSTVDR